jgi:hypothetical protein
MVRPYYSNAAGMARVTRGVGVHILHSNKSSKLKAESNGKPQSEWRIRAGR